MDGDVNRPIVRLAIPADGSPIVVADDGTAVRQAPARLIEHGNAYTAGAMGQGVDHAYPSCEPHLDRRAILNVVAGPRIRRARWANAIYRWNVSGGD